MPRRIALALALALTIVTTFSIVTVGSQTGLFGGGGDASAGEAYVEEAPVAGLPPEQPAQPAPQVYAPAPDPVVVTEYVYVDEPAPSQPRPRAAATPKPAATPKAKPAAPPEEPTVEQPPAEEPTAPPAAPTQPPAPPTAPPAAPTQPAGPPPGAAPAGPNEMEFTGTVTAINGDVVTFSHGGTTTDVRVTRDLHELGVGTVAKVHAIKLSTGYVAKEIEVKEGER